MLRLNCLYCGQPLRLNYRLTGPLLVFLTVLLVFLVPHSRSLCGCTAESLPPSAPHAITSQALYARECSRPSPLHVPHAPPAPRAPHSRYSPTSTFLALLLTLLAHLLTLLALLLTLLALLLTLLAHLLTLLALLLTLLALLLTLLALLLTLL